MTSINNPKLIIKFTQHHINQNISRNQHQRNHIQTNNPSIQISSILKIKKKKSLQKLKYFNVR
jgi:hypothetical protein